MSKYMDAINKGLEAAGDRVIIIGPTLLVEIVERDRKTASGIILQGNLMDKGRELRECIVLATGAGYYDDGTGQDVPLDTKQGDTVYCEPAYVSLLSDFPVEGYKSNTIGILNDTAVKLRFKGTGASDFRKGTGADK